MRAVLAGLVVTFAGLSLACGLAGTTDATAPPSKGVDKKETGNKVYSRDQFRALVVGKTPDEVLKAVGKPHHTRDAGGAGLQFWYYRGLTRDPVTGNTDDSANITFDKGVVSSVSF